MGLGGGLAWRVWARLSPGRAPTGPDVENVIGSVLAFETGRWDLYFDDRYPGYPWLVAALAPGPVEALTTTTTVSMAVTALAAIPLYFIGLSLSGRAAGLVGALMALRLAVSLDLGHSATHYPLVSTLDLGLLALGLCALQARRLATRWGCVVFMVALGTLAIASDPKQVPLVLGLVGLGGLLAAATGPGARGWRWPLALAGLAPLPLAHALVGRYHLGLLSLEALTIRTPLRFVDREAMRAVMHEGWALGAADAWPRLAPSFWRVARGVLPKAEGGGLDPALLDALPKVYPDTSAAWALALVALPALMIVRGRGPLTQRLGRVALVGVFVASAASPARLHYAHRYALPYHQAAPVGVAAALGLAFGGAAPLAAGLVAMGAGPYAEVDTGFLRRTSNQGDLWIGYEKTQDLNALRWALGGLPEGAAVFDHGEREALTTLAAGFPYVRCATTPDGCAAAMAAHAGPRVSVLRVEDQVSARVPGGEGRLRADARGLPPERVGACWQRLYVPGPGLGFYLWSCG